MADGSEPPTHRQGQTKIKPELAAEESMSLRSIVGSGDDEIDEADDGGEATKKRP